MHTPERNVVPQFRQPLADILVAVKGFHHASSESNHNTDKILALGLGYERYTLHISP